MRLQLPKGIVYVCDSMSGKHSGIYIMNGAQMRQSKAIPDEPKGKQLEHYVNGKDASDGMHPGIRSKCPECGIRDNTIGIEDDAKNKHKYPSR
jgi:hypothetical protein